MEYNSFFQADNALTTGRIAQIYFSFDSATLSRADRLVIGRAAQFIASGSPNGRVEVYLIGHTDKRGSDSYNKKLGRRRAKAVSEELDRLLGTSYVLNTVPIFSMGEEWADKKAESDFERAKDRRVDIYWLAWAASPTLPRLDTADRILRIGKRSYAWSSASNTAREGHGTTGRSVQRRYEKKAVRRGMNRIVQKHAYGAEFEIPAPVHESVGSRKYVWTDPKNRVIRAKVRWTVMSGTDRSAEWTYTTVDVDLQWGYPFAVMHVEVWRDDSLAIYKVPRGKADSLEFLFPPGIIRDP